MIIRISQLTNDVVSVLNNLIDMDIKASSAFKLMRIIKDLSVSVEFKLKSEKKILEKWSEKDVNNNLIPVYDNDGNILQGAVKIINMQEFEKDMADLLNIEIDIPYDKLNFEDLGLTDTLFLIKNPLILYYPLHLNLYEQKLCLVLLDRIFLVI